MADQVWVTSECYHNCLAAALADPLIFGGSTVLIGLLKNTGAPPVWGVNTSWADVVSQEADYTGYARQGTNATIVGTDAGGRAFTVLVPATFVLGIVPIVTNTIIGWFVTEGPGRLLFFKILDPVNWLSFVVGGTTLVVVPQLRMFDTSISP